jgi:hypothetical protein
MNAYALRILRMEHEPTLERRRREVAVWPVAFLVFVVDVVHPTMDVKDCCVRVKAMNRRSRFSVELNLRCSELIAAVDVP